MNLATAPATTQARVNGNGVHTSEVPPFLVDASGTALPSHGRDSWMARIDEKGSKEITLKQSTIWFIGTALVLLGVIFSYGTSAIGWIREDEAGRVERQTIKSDVKEIREDIKRLDDKFTSIEKMMQDQAVQKAKVDGYTLGQTDAGASGHKK